MQPRGTATFENYSQEIIKELRDKIFDKATYLTEVAYGYLNTAETALKESNDLWIEQTGLELIYGMLEQPPSFDTMAYNRLLFTLDSKEPKSNIVRFLKPSSNPIVIALDAFFLEQMGVSNQVKNHKDLLQYLLNLPLEDDEQHAALNLSAKNLGATLENAAGRLRPEHLGPLNAPRYVEDMKSVNHFLNQIKYATQHPLLSFLQAPLMQVPEVLLQNNILKDLLIKQFEAFNNERKKIAQETYANTEHFLRTKHEVEEIIKKHGMNASQFSKFFRSFLDDPTEINLRSFVSAAGHEKQNAKRSERNTITAFEKEANELAYLYACDQLNQTISAKSEADPMRAAGLRCLHDIQNAKKGGTDTLFLLDKITVVNNTLNNPNVFRPKLAEKAQEVARSGLKILGASLLCLFSVAVLVGSVYLAVQTAGAATPLTLATSKLALGLLATSIALAAASTYSLYKSASFFYHSVRTPDLRKSMNALGEESKKPPYVPGRI